MLFRRICKAQKAKDDGGGVLLINPWIKKKNNHEVHSVYEICC